MISKQPYYFRPESHLYHLNGHPAYYFQTGRSAGLQALWGFLGRRVYLILFGPSGDLKEVKSWGLPSSSGRVTVESHDAVLRTSSERSIQDLTLVTKPISVRRFWLSEAPAGIEDVADRLKEALEFPVRFDADELEDCRGSLADWKRRGQYVFWWEQSYYMSSNGDVEAS